MSKQILIVEDEALIAFEVEETLIESGYGVVAIAPTRSTALECLETQTPDGAILDANLDGESAEPVADRLIELGVPYLIMSGYSLHQIGDWAKGVTLLSKPFRHAELMARVDELLKGGESPA